MSFRRIKIKYLLLLLGIVVITTIPVLAAEQSGEEVYEEEYIVTATRIPKSVSEAPGLTETISGDEIEAGIDTVAEALEDHGFILSTNGGESSFARLEMDGAKDTQLQFLVNGVPINPDCGGSVDLSYFPAAGIDRIEVAHGPLSALYGANALGGVVNIITDLTGDPKNNLSLTGGSFTSRRFGTALKRENWGLAVGGNTTDGFRTHSATEGYYLTGQYDILQDGDEYLILRGNYMTKDAEQPGSLTWGGLGEQFNKRTMTDLSGKTNWLNGVWEYKIYGQKDELEYKNLELNTEDKHIVESYGLDLAALYERGNHELLAGTMIEVDSVDSTKSGRHSLDNIGLYLQNLWYVSEDLLFLSGLRWDNNSEYDSSLSPRLSITKYFTEDLNISFGYGEAFRAPTISDLYYEDTYYCGNLNLKPEKSKRFDITGKWRKEGSSYVVNIYKTLIEDGIRVTDDYSTSVNFDKIKINGVNMRIEKALTPNLTGQIGYKWLEELKLDNSTGKYSLDMPYGEHRWNLGVKYKKEHIASAIKWYIVSDRNDKPDYKIVDFNLKYLVNQTLSFRLSAHNLTDEEYQIMDGYPMPGRSFSAGLSYNF